MRREPRVARLVGAGLALALLIGCRTRGGDVLSLAAGGGGVGTGGSVTDAGGIGGGGGNDGRAGGAGGVGGASGGATGTASIFYISPDGSDGNPGTQAAPWRTFAHALPLLQPGSTLTLLDGTYTSATSGLLQVFCGTNAVNGTPDQPITVRALNERHPFIAGDGSGPPIELSACSNWVVDGLHAEETDAPHEMGDEPGSVVVLTHGCSNVVVRRVLGAHPNRYLTASVFVIAHGAPNVLIEECEALDFHYYGFHAYDSQRAVFRRDYAHSRDTPDVVGGTPTTPPTRGDGGFLLTKSSAGIIENCIAEDVADGFTIRGSRPQGGRVQPQRDQLLGDIASGISHAGFVLDSQCAGSKQCDQGDQIVSDATLANDVSRGGALGISFQGGVNITIVNASIFDASDTGISFSLDPDNMGLASSASARGSIVSAPGATFGFHSVGQVNWAFSQCNAFGPTQLFVPRDNHVMGATEIDPQLGGCLVFVPDGSPLKMQGQPGAGGSGANIVFQTVGGQLTTTKLWDQTTGQFPCGAVVAGLNDAALADVSCMGVGARLHVGAMGCAIP
jgi:hypothetical protein